MKKILFAAFAVTLLAASCQKTEIIGLDSDQANGPAMSFSTEMKKITKADETPDPTKTGTAKLESQGFDLWVYADFTEDDFANSTNVWLDADTYEGNEYLIYDAMCDLHMTYDSGWNAPNNREYYWPGTGKDLRFFAVSGLNSDANITINHGLTYTPEQESDEPATVNEPANDPTPEPITTPNLIITGFDVRATTDGKPTVDLMVADFRKQNQGQNSRVVKLNFRHALTKIDFKFKTSADESGELSDVFVQKLEVSDLNVTGDLTVTQGAKVTPAADGDDAEVYKVELGWSNLNTVDALSASWTADAASFPEKFTNINGALIDKDSTNDKDKLEYSNAKKSLKLSEETQLFDSWLMLPCENITGKIITITYIINNRQFQTKFSLGGKKTTATDGTATYQLGSWDVNQYVAYTIDLSPNKISFSASASDWTKFDGDGDKRVDEAEKDDAHGEDDPVDNDDDIVMNN